MPKKSSLKPVIVKWEDAVNDNGFDGAPADAGETEICVSIGFLVKKTTKMLVLAHERSVNGKTIRYTMSIPTGMVLEIIELKGFPDKT